MCLRALLYPAGFTLIEACVAAGVLAVGLVGVLRLVAAGAEATLAAGAVTAATVLAQQKVEQLRAVPWGDPELAPGHEHVEWLDANGRSAGARVFERRWWIGQIATPAGAAVLLRVSVRRIGAGADLGACRLISIRSRRGS